MDNDRLGAALTAAGATGVTFPALGACGGAPTVASSATTARCGPPGPPASIKLTVPPGSGADLLTRVMGDGDRTISAALFRPTGVSTVSGVDVLQRETGGTAAAGGGAQQAYSSAGASRSTSSATTWRLSWPG